MIAKAVKLYSKGLCAVNLSEIWFTVEQRMCDRYFGWLFKIYMFIIFT